MIGQFGTLAKKTEQRNKTICNQQVVGSNPTAGSILIFDFDCHFRFDVSQLMLARLVVDCAGEALKVGADAIGTIVNWRSHRICA